VWPLGIILTHVFFLHQSSAPTLLRHPAGCPTSAPAGRPPPSPATPAALPPSLALASPQPDLRRGARKLDCAREPDSIL
jgi:hypothetical protein